MTRLELASEVPHSNEGCDPPQGCTPRTTTARGPAVSEFIDVYPTELNRRGVTGV
jgi:hypothetical protein